MRKYIKPGSVTWWGGVAPLVTGLIIASEPLTGWADLSLTLRNVVGDVSPAALVNGGLIVIGLRAAPGVNLPKGV